MAEPLISVILPTLEAEADLQRLLPSLRAQRLWDRTELVAIDSDSTDGTRELLSAAGAEVARIARSDFRHGATRNKASALAKGRFLAFLSQDVRLEGEGYLEALIEPFQDPRVAGVTARVLPHEGSDLLTARTVLDLPEAGTLRQVHDLGDHQGLWELSVEQCMRILRFNNVASAARSEVFRRIPFPELTFAEDFAWAARVISARHRIVFTPEAVARHGHEYGLRSVFERYAVDACFHLNSHSHRIRHGPLAALKGLAFESAADWRHAFRSGTGARPRDLLYSPLLRGAQVAGQLAGSLGWQPRRFRPRLPARSLPFQRG